MGGGVYITIYTETTSKGLLGGEGMPYNLYHHLDQHFYWLKLISLPSSCPIVYKIF
jgi:hypothetical protein